MNGGPEAWRFVIPTGNVPTACGGNSHSPAEGSRHSGAIRETGSGGLDPAVIHAAHVPREAMPPASAGLQIQHSDLGARMLVFEVFRGLDRDGLIIAVRLAVNGSPAGVIRLDHCL